ncbi:MAG: ATP-binding cassette domain-containing protein [Gemmatimonadetes bacterium]|nr:ATP-binding cassette domain-containing protein [Gemmatimonadota bacterium]
MIPSAERGQLLQLVLMLLAAALTAAVFQAVRGVALLRIEARAGAALQAAVWDRLLALPLPFFRGYSAGELAARAMGVEEMRRAISGGAVSALLTGVFSLANLGLLFAFDARLGAVAAALVGVALALCLAFGWAQMRGQRAILHLRSRTSGLVLQLLRGISKLRIAGAETQAFGEWARLFGEQRQRQFRARTLASVLAVFYSAYPTLCSLALFAAAAPRMGGDAPLRTGSFLGFLAAFHLCLGGALSACGALIGVLSAVPLYEQLKPILQTEPEGRRGSSDPGALSGALEFRQVTFRYPGAATDALRDLSFRVSPGEFVAFVGPSGSGKSTILRLLLGFEAPASGAVLFDGQELAGLDVQAVRAQIGGVLQSGRVTSDSLFSNIVGGGRASQDDAWEAARLAGLEEDIRRMPMGMHTVVNDGGGTLSGGQRQRLLIARALFNRAPIMVLDEATSALDNRTQATVAESLEGCRATRVVVAHRLSTVRDADRVYVVDGGRIVESGSPSELMAREGVFFRMAQRQLV